MKSYSCHNAILALLAILVSVILMVFSTPATAAKSSGSSGSFSSSSKGAGIRSAPSRLSAGTSSGSGSVQYKNFKPLSGSASASASPSGRGIYQGRGSVLDRSSIKPSEKLQTVIQEKESSEPGWVGTGLLVWLLSQHDLSTSDREWVQSRIDEARKDGEDIAAPPPELSDVIFNWVLPEKIVPGQDVIIRAAAIEDKKPLIPDCEINGQHGHTEDQNTVLEWKTASAVSAVVLCTADGWTDMRLLTVGD